MRNTMVEIGTIIKKRRELLGVLQPRLAAIAGVSVRTIQLVELGKANPSLETLLKLTEPLGLQLQLTLKDANR